MPKLTDHENLVKRKGTKNFTIRVQIPSNVRHRFNNKKQIWQSSKTPNLKEAVLMRDQVLSDYKLQFMAIRAGGTDEVIDKTIDNYRKVLLDIRGKIDSSSSSKEIEDLSTAFDALSEQAQDKIEQLVAPSGIPNVTGHNNPLGTAQTEEEYKRLINPAVADSIEDYISQIHAKAAPSNVKINEWQKEYIKEVKEINAKQSLAEVKKFCEKYPRTSYVTYDSVTGYIKSLRATKPKGNSKSTIRKKLNWLRNYWRFLQREKVISRGDRISQGNKIIFATPFDGHDVRALQTDDTDVLAYKPEEMVKIWRYIRKKKNRNKDYIRVVTALMYTGARLSDVVTQFTEENIKEEYIYIRIGKNRQSRREIPIHPLLYPMLEEIKKSGYFSNITSKYVTKNFMKDREACGFTYDKEANTKYDLHSIRHTCSTEMANAGVSDLVIEKIFGHKGISTLRKTYIGTIRIENKLEAIKTIEYPFNKEELKYINQGFK